MNIIFVRLEKKGVYAWHYVDVFKTKLPLIKNLEDKDVDIAEYGKILDSGWGYMPPQSIIDKYPSVKV